MNNYVKGISVLAFLLFGLFAFAWALGETFQSLIIAFILAYFLFPFIEKMEKLGIPRSLVAIVIILLIAGLIFFAIYFTIPRLLSDIHKFILLLPAKISQLTLLIIEFGNRFGIKLDEILYKYSRQEYVIDWIEGHVSQFSDMVLFPLIKASGKGLSSLRGAITGIINLVIIPIFFFFLVNSYEKITENLGSFLPSKQRSIVANYLNHLNDVLSGYFRGQIGLSLFVSAYYSIVLGFLGLHFGILIGLATGLLNMVPYVGITISVILSMLSVVFYSEEIIRDLWLVLVIYGFEISFEVLYLYPRFVGKKIGLKTLEIMLALSAGVNVGGIFGALLAVPLAAVLKAVIIDAINYYKQTEIYQKSL